jgi:hypothetical protein
VLSPLAVFCAMAIRPDFELFFPSCYKRSLAQRAELVGGPLGTPKIQVVAGGAGRKRPGVALCRSYHL